MDTWTTPLGVKLTVAGPGGPWITITNHNPQAPRPEKPLAIPLPAGVDKGFYYRNGWQPAGGTQP